MSSIGLPAPASGLDRTTTADLLAWGDSVVDALGRNGAYIECAVFVFDETVDALRLVAARGCTGPDGTALVPGDTLEPVLDTVCGWAYRFGRPALVGDVRRGGVAGAEAARRSQLAVPIIVAGRTVGVLAVSGPRVGQFGIVDVDQLQGAAQDAAAALVQRGLC